MPSGPHFSGKSGYESSSHRAAQKAQAASRTGEHRNQNAARSLIVSPDPPPHPMLNASKESVASKASVLSKASKAEAMRII